MFKGIDRAIMQAGGQRKLAERLGITQQTISYWRKKGGVPINRVAEVEAVTGVERDQLLPAMVLDALTSAKALL